MHPLKKMLTHTPPLIGYSYDKGRGGSFTCVILMLITTGGLRYFTSRSERTGAW
jgi:hypothetical protein